MFARLYKPTISQMAVNHFLIEAGLFFTRKGSEYLNPKKGGGGAESAPPYELLLIALKL